jgi:hypothetical protein
VAAWSQLTALWVTMAIVSAFWVPFAYFLGSSTRLTLSSAGLGLRQVGFHVTTPWSNVLSFHPARGEEGFVLRDPLTGRGVDRLTQVASLRAYRGGRRDLAVQGRFLPIEPFAYHLTRGRLWDDVLFKDESTHPSGSLKHRLARSLFLYGLCNGWIKVGTPIVEASWGSTAISEAYFARLLEMPFHTVIPESTSKEKVHKIEFYGGICHPICGSDIYSAAQKLADELGGHYMDQFTYAERATDWRGNNNIAESLFRQMEAEPYREPTWVVV